MVKEMNENDILCEYWKLIGLEESIPYNEISVKDKESVINTSGYQQYVLSITLQELKKAIYSCLPKFLMKLLGVSG